MEKIIFLDMDGVIIEEKNHLYKTEDIELIPRAEEAIKLLNEANYRIVAVTNKSVVARGLCTFQEVLNLHENVKEILRERGAVIDQIYFCPHHPTEGANPQYTRDCECRKPKIGMLLEESRNLGKDLEDSFIIGDKTSDIKTGENAGCRTILLETGYGGKDRLYPDITPTFTAKNLYDAVLNVVLRE